MTQSSSTFSSQPVISSYKLWYIRRGQERTGYTRLSHSNLKYQHWHWMNASPSLSPATYHCKSLTIYTRQMSSSPLPLTPLLSSQVCHHSVRNVTVAQFESIRDTAVWLLLMGIADDTYDYFATYTLSMKAIAKKCANDTYRIKNRPRNTSDVLYYRLMTIN